MNRKPRVEVARLSDTTWFGTVAIVLTTALRRDAFDGKQAATVGRRNFFRRKTR